MDYTLLAKDGSEIMFNTIMAYIAIARGDDELW